MSRSPHSSASSSAFPRGTYAKYKRATSYFLSWLQHAGNTGLGASNNDRNLALDGYDRIVHAIAAAPTSFSPALLQRLPRALAACASAITLRTRVASFLGDAADDTHRHFVERMKQWMEMLTHACAALADGLAQQGTKNDALDVTSFYAVLALPDDYFPDDDDPGSDDGTPLASVSPSLATTDDTQLQVGVFSDDFETELACTLMELDELSEAVYTAFYNVKRETKTLVEATVVAKVAIDSAEFVVANLEMRHPDALRDGGTLSELIQDRLSLPEISQLVAHVQAAWQPSDDASAIRYQYLSGTVLVDMVGIVSLLRLVSQRVPVRMNRSGMRYDEETTRHFVVPGWGHLPEFFLHHLPDLLNLLDESGGVDASSSAHGLQPWFLAPFDTFRKTGEISTRLVFSCICWIRSIAALQGDRGLARTTSLSITHLRDLQRRLGDSLVSDNDRSAMCNRKQVLYERLQGLDVVTTHMRVNPLLAGCVLLDLHTWYLTIGHDLLVVGLFRALCHVYSALCTRQFLDAIPFIEDAIAVYEASVFTPSRAAATDGSFARSFLASHNLLEVTILNKRVTARPDRAKSVVEKGRMKHLSHILGLLENNDFSGLAVAPATSWSTFLFSVADLCREELFGSRVLSRDALKLTDDLTDMFDSLCDTLGHRDQLNRMIGRGIQRFRAVENAVVVPLLAKLDAHVDPGGELNDQCRQAAVIIFRTFGDSSRIERDYFTFPATPTWISAAFGSPHSEAKPCAVAAEEFNAVYKMLETSPVPLQGEQLEEFKCRVAAAPAVLTMTLPDRHVELCSLLHHAAAGPANDLLLVEWLIQMGALENQPTYWRNRHVLELQPETFQDLQLPDTLAVHCAARKGYSSVVKLILEADNFRDLNTTTMHSQEPFTHIAVRNGDPELLAWLVLHGATCSGTNASGQHIWELTSDRKWKAKLKHFVSREKVGDESIPADSGFNDMYAVKRQQGSTEAARHDRCDTVTEIASLEASSPEPSKATSRDTSPSAPSTEPSRSCGAKAKKKRNKKQTQAVAQNASPITVATATNRIGQRLVSEPLNRDGDNLQALAADVALLQTNAFASLVDREWCVRRVFDMYEHCTDSVDTIVSDGLLSQSAAVKRAVRDAGQVLLLMHSLPQHLGAVANEDETLSACYATLRGLITPADNESFTHFSFSMRRVAVAVWYCGLTQLWHDMVAAMEHHVRSMDHRFKTFRRVVDDYAYARTGGMGTSAHAAGRQLPSEWEWYATDHGVHDEHALDRLDRLFGCHFYLRVKCLTNQQSQAFESYQQLLDQRMPHGRDAVYVAHHIIADAETKDQLMAIRKVVLDAATQSRVKLEYRETDLMLPSVEIYGFTFSATGIVRKAP